MSDEPKRGRGRPRRAGADETILNTALTMLRELGYRDVTVDAIAERTSIAKTTIYRRWPTKGALISAAIAPLAQPSPDATHEEVLRETANLLRMIGQPDGEIIEVLRTLLHPRWQLLGANENAHREVGALL